MDEVNKALQKIAKDTGVIFFGTIVSLLFAFLSRVVIARFYSPFEYGIFSMALTVISIVIVVTSFGFPNGIPREVAFYREREPSRVKKIVSTSIFVVSIGSLIFFILTFLASEFVAQIFDGDVLNLSIKIMAFAIPFSAIIGIMVSIYRGFGRTKEQVYFQNFIYNILFLVFVLIIAILNLPFISVFYSYLAAQILTFMALVFYSYRFRLFEIGFAFNMNVGKDLLLFSLPLLISSILVFVLNWTDTLMLGYYKSADVVGLYNAASPLAKLIPIVLSSAGFIYMPVASSLYAKGKIKEMGRTYQMLTKWIFLLTLPIFSIMFLFPEATIYFLFGAQYLPASQTLRILSLGFIFHTFLGLNGLSLVVIKESTSLLFASTVSATANVVLNILLIPFYGIEGAAIASAASYFMGNILITLQLYKKTRIHPFSWNYVKPLVISFILLILVQKIIGQNISIWHALAILILFLVIYFLLVLLSKSVDKEDVELFLAVEEKLGVDLEIIKRILRRFV